MATAATGRLSEAALAKRQGPRAAPSTKTQHVALAGLQPQTEGARFHNKTFPRERITQVNPEKTTTKT